MKLAKNAQEDGLNMVGERQLLEPEMTWQKMTVVEWCEAGGEVILSIRNANGLILILEPSAGGL